jgi:hypothetical protein
MMTRASMIAIAILTGAGCAGGDQRLGDAGTGSSQQEAAHQTTDYRSQANSLREMADRRQLEADILAREVGPDDASVAKKRRLAEELRAAASEAENKARDLRRNVPHGMVQ